ncbi:MAG: glycosyl transferase family 2 [Bacillales bacterium]|jgi:glycosyltransferase involved in cell wall biosynthesis|nr:glycosyl transferase family 2 [Bacillales bacterium]
MTKPVVSVVLATYFPDEKFFEKQLRSIDDQTYTNIELLICDDSESEEQFQFISELLKKTIVKVPYTLFRNEKNCGSNKTFSRLTLESKGNYIAYCDQDDIWLPVKIEDLMQLIETKNSTLAYSDLSLINENDQVTATSMLKSNFRMKHVYGDEAFSYLVESNSVTGCSMLIEANLAKNALPFPEPKVYVHDHWLAIYAAAKGNLVYSAKPLVHYRIHEQNQIGVKRFHGLQNVEDYVRAKIEEPLERLELVKERIDLNDKQVPILDDKILLLKIRLSRSKKERFYTLHELKLVIKSNPVLFIFETILFMSGKTLQVFILNFKNHFVKKITRVVNKLKPKL